MKLFRVTGQTIEELPELSFREGTVYGVGEDRLQTLLTTFPSIIPSDQIDPDDPPLFLMVRREATVKLGSIDVLLVDHNGVPTVVEAKLVDNREIRREVLAQGLEYLSRLRSDWTAQKIIQEARAFAGNQQEPGLARLDDPDFVKALETNLSENRLRLIVAADRIPLELRGTIEFLSAASMFDVYGLEVNLFTRTNSNGDVEVVLAPQLVGASEGTRRKPGGRGSLWDHETFFEELPTGHHELVKEMIALCDDIPDRSVKWGRGKERGSQTVQIDVNGRTFGLFSVYTTSKFTVNAGFMFRQLPGDLTESFRDRVNVAFDVSFDRKTWERLWPFIPLDRLTSEKLEDFNILIHDLAKQVRAVASQ